MDFQHHLQNTWRLLKEHPFLLLLGGLLVQLLIILSLGILAGPLAGGFLLTLITYFRSGRPPVFNDLFIGLQRLLQLLPFFLLGLLIMVGFFFFVIPGIIFITWWLYTLPLMADQQLPLSQAMRASYRKVRERGFFMHLVFLFMITVFPTLLINVAGLIIPPLEILHLFFFPIQSALLASLYLEQFGPEATACPLSGPPSAPIDPNENTVRRGLD
jgi:hypothetical protein